MVARLHRHAASGCFARSILIDHARHAFVFHATRAAFLHGDEDEVRRVVNLVFHEWELSIIRDMQQPTDHTPEQRRGMLINHCCEMLGANEEVGAVVVAAVNAVTRYRGRE